MSCNLSITSPIPCSIPDHSPKCGTDKTASLAALLRKISFCSETHLIGLLPAKLRSPSQLHLVFPSSMESDEILKTNTVLLPRHPRLDLSKVDPQAIRYSRRANPIHVKFSHQIDLLS